MIVLIGLTFLDAVTLLTLPWLGGRLSNAILNIVETSMMTLGGLILLALGASAILRTATSLVSGQISEAMLADLRCRVHDHLQRLPLSFHQAHTQGNLLALSTYEIARLGGLLTGTLVALPAQVVMASGAVILMARIDARLAGAAFVLVPLFYLGLRGLGRQLRGLGQVIQEAEASVVSTASEDLAMLPAIKSFTREEEHARRFAKIAEAARDLRIRQNAIYAALGPAINFMAGSAAVALLVVMGQQVQAGAMAPAELVSFLLYASLLTRPVAQLAQVYGQVQTARGTLSRLADILDTPVEPSDPAAPRLGRSRGEIAFEDVHFAYPGRPSALRGVTLTLKAGETVALTGPNGAGKSTLMSLLLRFDVPHRGAIWLDGINVENIALHDLRRQIGVVPQRPLLFDGTVRDNIAFGREGADDAAIKAAARMAQAHGFILDLQDGYETRIGEHGVRLSGGQGQRVALARALLKDPPVLILDEATSMYDLEGESAFVDAAASALRGRTVILITHRPATLALAQRVVTLDAGRIVAERSAA